MENEVITDEMTDNSFNEKKLSLNGTRNVS